MEVARGEASPEFSMLSSLTRWPALTHSAVLGAVRAGGVIAAIYAFLYVFLPATGIEPIARLNLALAIETNAPRACM